MFRVPGGRASLAAPVVALVLHALVACGDDLPPASEVSTSPVPGPGGRQPDGSAVIPSDDAGALADDASDASSEPACVGPALGGSLVTADLLLGPLPGDEGGAVVEGTYDLAEVVLYGVPDEVGDGGVLPDPVPAMRATLKVAAGTFELTSQLDGETPTSRRATYHLDDVFLATEGICPTSTPVFIPYTATGASITLHTGTRRWETFTLR